MGQQTLAEIVLGAPDAPSSINDADAAAIVAEVLGTPPLSDPLAKRLLKLFDEAHSYKQRNYLPEMREAYYAAQNEYTPEDKCKIQDPKERELYAGLFNRQLSTYMAWVLDRISQTTRFFTIEPTPIPKVPLRYKSQAVGRVFSELKKLSNVPLDVAMEYARQRLIDLKAAINEILYKDAQRATVGAEKAMDDVLAEGDFRTAYMQFHHNMFLSLGVMKFPSVHIVERLHWSGDTMEIIREPVLKFKAVSPFDFYWSPDSTNAQDGSYIIERTRMDYTALKWMHEKAGGIVKDTTSYLLKYVRSNISWVEKHIAAQNQTELAADVARMDATVTSANGLFDVLVFHTNLFGYELLQYGVREYKHLRTQKPVVAEDMYPCEVWLVDGLTAYVAVNPHPTGVRPYHVASYEPIPGQLYGVSAWKKIKPWEIKFRSGHRLLLRATSFEAGVIAEVDSSRFSSTRAPTKISPWMQYHVDPDYTGGGQLAIRFPKPATNSQGLRVYLADIEAQAQHATGIYNTMAGSTAYGTIARTRFGVQTVEANATKIVFAKSEYLDKFTLEPMLRMLYTYLMVFGDDDSIKADAQVVVKGLTSVATRESQKQLLLQLLQYLPAMMQIDAAKGTNAVPQSLIQSLFRSIVDALGGNTDDMPDPDSVSSVAQAIGLLPPDGYVETQQQIAQEMPFEQIKVPPST